MNRKLLALAIASALASAPQLALSAVVWDNEDGPAHRAEPAPSASAPFGGGAAAPSPGAPADNRLANGFGRSVPLQIALRMIVPSDYDLTIERGVNGRDIVSWRGGRSWVDVANDTAGVANAHIVVEGRRVLVRPGQALGRSQIATAPLPGSSRAPMAIAPVSLTADPFPASAPPVVQGWTVEPGVTLRETLLRWTERAKWTLVWDAPNDYPIEAGVVFNGEFMRAVEDLSFALQNLEPPIEIELFTRNSVLKVSPRGASAN